MKFSIAEFGESSGKAFEKKPESKSHRRKIEEAI
jgi:hypothetical protein